jgi:cobalt/nickel transport system permease protein
MLAISTALLIQALFFGDGGVMAFGANAFNMAIAGCLVTYAVYRVLLPIFSRRTWAQPVAAAIAAYVAINVSALLTAVEFGIQPMLFKDASGHALYAPFPLSVAVPAMLIGHLTIAGLAEFVITGGVIAYLQRTSPGLIADRPSRAMVSWKAVVTALAVLVVLTPLGLLATGHAWGEWSAKDFQNPATRLKIEKTTPGAAVPVRPPSGLQRFESLWTAPLRDYSPRFIANNSAGYVVSALTGVCILFLVIFSFGALFGKRGRNRDGENPL